MKPIPALPGQVTRLWSGSKPWEKCRIRYEIRRLHSTERSGSGRRTYELLLISGLMVLHCVLGTSSIWNIYTLSYSCWLLLIIFLVQLLVASQLLPCFYWSLGLSFDQIFAILSILAFVLCFWNSLVSCCCVCLPEAVKTNLILSILADAGFPPMSTALLPIIGLS